MKKTRLLNYTHRNTRVILERIESDVTLHDYGLSKQTWLRAVSFIQRYGTDQALELIDQRANSAADRKDIRTAYRWRSLITAIHAITADEKLPGDNSH